MSDTRSPIPPNPPRWQPNANPDAMQVPGLDTSGSVNEQIEQIEQLITIKLQNIDENFSKIHNVLATKILPSVKRYATGTEPVREAAKFWTAFYEQAAQIRIPTYDEYSTVNEEDPTEEPESAQPANTTPSEAGSYEPSMTSTESSFMPGQALYASTPATAPRHRTTRPRDSLDSENSEDPSWTTSMESPIVRLDREIQNFSLEDDDDDDEQSSSSSSRPIPAPSFSRANEGRSETAIPSLRVDKGKGKETHQPLLRNVLRNNTMREGPSSPRKPKTPIIPKSRNPYLPADTKPAEWNGLVNLSQTPLSTPLRGRRALNQNDNDDSDDDDSFDGLPPGMSPPVLFSPAKPPRSSAELARLKLGQTPTKAAAARIKHDLVSDFQRQSARKIYGYAQSDSDTMSSMPTPPSMSRYARETDTGSSIVVDASLESMMRRVGLAVPPSASTPGLRLRHQPPSNAVPSSSSSVAHPIQQQQQPPPVFAIPNAPVPPTNNNRHRLLVIDDEIDPNLDDSDSMDDDQINDTAHPSAAFLMAASHGTSDADESFGSSDSSGFCDDDDGGGFAPINPFANNNNNQINDFDDDSFDDDDGGMGMGMVRDTGDSETLFGVNPVRPSEAQLRMLGEDLLEDTLGYGAQAMHTGSPTPASYAPR